MESAVPKLTGPTYTISRIRNRSSDVVLFDCNLCFTEWRLVRVAEDYLEKHLHDRHPKVTYMVIEEN